MGRMIQVMQKIYIIGSVASGKTTLAKKLSKQLGIPYYALDDIVYAKSGKVRRKRTLKEQEMILKMINQKEDWICEGVYRKSYHDLLDWCDHIIFLDTPLWKRNYHILLRHTKQNLRLESCSYRPNVAMLRAMYGWSRDFEKTKEHFERLLRPYKHKIIVIRKSDELKDRVHTVA